MKAGDLQPAYEALKHAQELNPGDAPTAEMLFATTLDLAHRNQDAHQYTDALQYFADAAKQRPEDPAPHRGLAEIYQLTGRPAEAKAEQDLADKLGKSGAS